MFQLHLSNGENIRVANYDPYKSTMKWEDTGEDTIVESNIKIKSYKNVHATSFENPAAKVNQLKKIKIQLGFSCNYSCSYCSQNSQRSFAADTAKKTLEKTELFFQKMEQWYDPGEAGDGSGTKLEFWGGETLLYWSSVEYLTVKIRARYPKMGLLVFTNGSLIKKEMVDFAAVNKVHFAVSHDGPTFNEDRAKDPFEIPEQAENLHYCFQTLNPLNLISFNATLSPKNYSLVKIREYIANKLRVSPSLISLSNDLLTPYDSVGLTYVTEESKRRELVTNIFEDTLKLYPFDLSVGMIGIQITEFYQSLISARMGETVGQKCSMDLPTSIALDIDGNVLTCQNVTSKGGHNIGHIDEFDGIKLTTATHWSKRDECRQCPVVQICRGACMFLKNELWSAACNQHFTWALAQLSLSLYLQTDRKLIKITGSNIRSKGVTEVGVLNTNDT